MFECVQICTVSDTLHALQRPPPVRSTRRGLSDTECRPVQRAQRPGVCVGAWRGLPCIWHGLPCCLCCAVCPGALGLGSPPAGHTAAAQPRPVSPVTTEKIKKAQKITPPLLPISKIFRKNKKTPTKGLCSVLYLPYKP